jgi:hypothetical protein
MPNGYLYIKAGGKMHSASRLAWSAAHGGIPSGLEIDHINRVKTDNRLANLRLVTSSQNKDNRAFRSNTVGLTGVSIHKKSGLFRARRKNKTLYFKTKEEAAEAYAKMAKSL